MLPDAETRNPRLEGDALLQDVLATDPARWRCAWQVRREHFPPLIRFDRPTKTLPISLTGRACALQCAHCAGRYLEHMHPIWEAQPNGANSLLISGGCDNQGRVPIDAHLERVARLRGERRLNWHVGLVDDAYMQRIAPYVDVISFDVVGDRDTAKEVYGLDMDLADYMRTYDLLRRYAPVVPHITVGLRAGKLSGEFAALHALQQRSVDTLILIVLIPTPGTAFATCEPPPLEQVADLFLQARAMLPSTRLYLGCMRPTGRYRQLLDEIAVRAGLNAIVNPSRVAERVAAELGLEIAWGEECCALW